MDWGTAPAWAAIVVAIVAGWFAYKNVSTAQKAYADNSWDRKVRVARVVYSRTRHRSIVEAGAFHPGYDQKPEVVFGSELFDETISNRRGESFKVSSVDTLCLLISISNQSSEPVSRVGLSIKDHTGYLIDGLSFDLGVLPSDEGDLLVQVWIEGTWTQADADALQPVLAFTDSAGVRWVRTESQPPEEADVQERKRLKKA